jgi:hypothetical protein
MQIFKKILYYMAYTKNTRSEILYYCTLVLNLTCICLHTLSTHIIYVCIYLFTIILILLFICDHMYLCPPNLSSLKQLLSVTETPRLARYNLGAFGSLVAF